MKRSLHTLEQLQMRLAGEAATNGGSSGSTVAQRRAAEAAKQQRLKKLTPYKQAEYHCVECVAELRQALHNVEELEDALGRGSSGGVSRSREEEEEARDVADAGDIESMGLLRRREGCRGPARSADTALLEHELARSRQLARRAHHRLQQLQREAARLASEAAAAAPAVASSAAVTDGGDASAPSTAVVALDWQRALQHVERAKQWYRSVFGIRVVSSVDDPVLQLNRPAQPQQSAGSMAHFGRGANAIPSSVTAAVATSSSSARLQRSESAVGNDVATATTVAPLLVLRSAREDAEFREFFASVQESDALIDAAMDRLTDGVGRLLENARGMQDELTAQEALLEQTGVRAEANEAQLMQMNRRLHRATREIEDSSVCMYVVCLLLLLLVLGVLLRIAG
ncbi:hypothetical protein GH5_08131 [Leishmania sp. Ghana 2012 LV757]|uniref:hypothetical protein n=1 Tax=Leishmania sp. Ghana 2012 LV757 TaxID=2803181 RepID=UPI001B46C4E9|nr:hypothetical protein GH5_08131 [Leishmania sp. Ghana 2012 LV757]